MLSDVKARKMKPDGYPNSDGGIKGLYLYPSTVVGTGKWVLRFTSPENGKRRDMGLGNYPIISFRNARDKAFQLRHKIENGADPLEERWRLFPMEQKHLSILVSETAARTLHADIVRGLNSPVFVRHFAGSLSLAVRN